MSNDESVLREVDQELAEDRQWAVFRQYGPYIIGGAVAIVLGVAGFQVWNGMRDNAAKEQSLALRNALELMEEDASGARDDLAAISEETGTGVGVLAQFYRAASFARDRDREAAIEVYTDVYRTGSAPKRLKSLARLRAAHLALADGRDAVLPHLGDLETSVGPFGFYAKETAGLAAIVEEDYQTAIAIFDELNNAADAPGGISVRAREFAAHARTGKSGINITRILNVDNIATAIGGDSEVLGPELEDHSGHDHPPGEHPGDEPSDEEPIVDDAADDEHGHDEHSEADANPLTDAAANAVDVLQEVTAPVVEEITSIDPAEIIQPVTDELNAVGTDLGDAVSGDTSLPDTNIADTVLQSAGENAELLVEEVQVDQ